MIVVKNNSVSKSARKVRQVSDLIRRKKVEEALRILRFNDKKEISIMLTKLLNSGLQIASDSEKYDLDNLIVETIEVNEGPTLKRIQPRAQGRAFRIRKRTQSVMHKAAYLIKPLRQRIDISGLLRFRGIIASIDSTTGFISN